MMRKTVFVAAMLMSASAIQIEEAKTGVEPSVTHGAKHGANPASPLARRIAALRTKRTGSKSPATKIPVKRPVSPAPLPTKPNVPKTTTQPSKPVKAVGGYCRGWKKG